MDVAIGNDLDKSHFSERLEQIISRAAERKNTRQGLETNHIHKYFENLHVK
jgi:hypothetical protein